MLRNILALAGQFGAGEASISRPSWSLDLCQADALRSLSIELSRDSFESAQAAGHEGRRLLQAHQYKQAAQVLEQGLKRGSDVQDQSVVDELSLLLQQAMDGQQVVQRASYALLEGQSLLDLDLCSAAIASFEFGLEDGLPDCSEREELSHYLELARTMELSHRTAREICDEAWRIVLDAGDFDASARMVQDALAPVRRRPVETLMPWEDPGPTQPAQVSSPVLDSGLDQQQLTRIPEPEPEPEQELGEPATGHNWHAADRELLKLTLTALEQAKEDYDSVQAAGHEGRRLLQAHQYKQAAQVLEQGLKRGSDVQDQSVVDELSLLLQQAMDGQQVVQRASYALLEGQSLLDLDLCSAAIASFEFGLEDGLPDCSEREELSHYLELARTMELSHRTAREICDEAWRIVLDAGDFDASEFESMKQLFLRLPLEPETRLSVIGNASKCERRKAAFRRVVESDVSTESSSSDEDSDQNSLLAKLFESVSQVASVPAELQTTVRDCFDLATCRMLDSLPAGEQEAQAALAQAQDWFDEEVDKSFAGGIGDFQAIIRLLRPLITEELEATNPCLEDLELLFFETLQLHTGQAQQRRKHTLQARLAAMDPSAKGYEELQQALARTEADAGYDWEEAEEEDDERALSEFQQMADAVQDNFFASSKVGISVERLLQLLARGQEDLQQLRRKITPELIRSLGSSEDLKPIKAAIEAHFARSMQLSDDEMVHQIEQFQQEYMNSSQAVCDIIMHSVDSAAHGDSYVHRMWSEKQSADIGVATYLVCHDRSNSVDLLKGALVSFLQQQQIDSDKAFVYLDLFCAPIGVRAEAPTSAFELCSTVVLVMDTNVSPRVLQNTQCRVEMLRAMELDVPINVVFSPDGLKALKKRLTYDGLATVVEAITTVPGVVQTEAGELASVARELYDEQSSNLHQVLQEQAQSLIDSIDMKGLVWIEHVKGGTHLDLQLGEVQTAMGHDHDGAVAIVHTDDGQQHHVDAEDLKHACRPVEDMNSDLTQLTFLHDVAVLHTLRRRYFGGGTGHGTDSESFYCTYIGQILVYVNPYAPSGTWVDAHPLYSYLKFKLRVRDEASLHPHPYAIADLAYRELLSSKHDQAVFVGGESGAGKTEACKFMLKYLLAAQKQDGKQASIAQRQWHGMYPACLCLC